MAIKYWEFEDAPMKEKLKNLNVKEIAKLFFDNETEAYRFGLLLYETKKRGSLRLRDIGKKMPVSTAKRYLDYAVQLGLLKHEGSAYMPTDRFTRPFRNIATYIKSWMESQTEEDLEVQFPIARKTDKAAIAKEEKMAESAVAPAPPAQ
jgi:hypothetical protein